MSRDRSSEPSWLSSGEESVLFWLCLSSEEMAGALFEEHCWSWTPMANEIRILRPCPCELDVVSIDWIGIDCSLFDT